MHPVLRFIGINFRDGMVAALRNFWLLLGLGLCLGEIARAVGLTVNEGLAGAAVIYFTVRLAIRDERGS